MLFKIIITFFLTLSLIENVFAKKQNEDYFYPKIEPHEIPKNSPRSKVTKRVQFNQLKKIKYKDKTFIYRHNFKNGLFNVWRFKKGAFVQTHRHDTDQITHVLKGKVKIVQGSDKKVFIFKQGDTFELPALVFHNLEALEDSEMVGVNPATTEGKSAQFHH
jgi:quercetin dioxygenase-like cupin family protein